jgi:hypothetical protein
MKEDMTKIAAKKHKNHKKGLLFLASFAPFRGHSSAWYGRTQACRDEGGPAFPAIPALASQTSQTDAVGPIASQTIRKHLTMNYLQNKPFSGGSGSVKVRQTSLQSARREPLGIASAFWTSPIAFGGRFCPGGIKAHGPQKTNPGHGQSRPVTVICCELGAFFQGARPSRLLCGASRAACSGLVFMVGRSGRNHVLSQSLTSPGTIRNNGCGSGILIFRS